MHTHHIWFWLKCKLLLSSPSWAYISHKRLGAADMPSMKPIGPQKRRGGKSRCCWLQAPLPELHKSILYLQKCRTEKGRRQPNAFCCVCGREEGLCVLSRYVTVTAICLCQWTVGILSLQIPYLNFNAHTDNFSHLISKIYLFYVLFFSKHFFKNILKAGSIWLSW